MVLAWATCQRQCWPRCGMVWFLRGPGVGVAGCGGWFRHGVVRVRCLFTVDMDGPRAWLGMCFLVTHDGAELSCWCVSVAPA
eukprot:1537704-Alexandrium_andersonii.AAC.1